MKKTILTLLSSICMSVGVQAQALKYTGKNFNLPKYAIEINESVNGASPVVYKSKNLIVDEVNGYVFNVTNSTYQEKDIVEKNAQYNQYVVWNSAKGKIVGSFLTNVNLIDKSVKTTGLMGSDSGLNLRFTFPDPDKVLETQPHDENKIKEEYEKALAKMSAKGAEGSECFYAEMPRKGTTIKLFIALGSEIAKNAGVPKWKMPFGELVFNKTTAKFTFVKK